VDVNELRGRRRSGKEKERLRQRRVGFASAACERTFAVCGVGAIALSHCFPSSSFASSPCRCCCLASHYPTHLNTRSYSDHPLAAPQLSLSVYFTHHSLTLLQTRERTLPIPPKLVDRCRHCCVPTRSSDITTTWLLRVFRPLLRHHLTKMLVPS